MNALLDVEAATYGVVLGSGFRLIPEYQTLY
jgi:hypothetical protein